MEPQVALLRAGPLQVAVRLALGGALFWSAFDHGSYAITQRTLVGFAVWWTLGIATAAGVLRVGFGRSGILAFLGLSSLALLELVSMRWSHDATSAFDEFSRVLVYVGILLLSMAVTSSFGAAAIADVLAIGTAAIAVLAFASRCHPSIAAGRLPGIFQAVAVNRLSFPLDYWNGLAIFVALGVPVLLWRASQVGNALRSALAAAPLPIIAVVLFLTSSRGGIVTAVAGAVVYVVLSGARWRSTITAVIGVALGVVAVLAVTHFHRVAAYGVGVGRQGRQAAIAIAALCAVAFVVQFVVASVQPARQPSATVGWLAASSAVVLAAVSIALVHPVAKAREFVLPASQAHSTSDSIEGHLLSANGNGRWQQWTAALREWETKPALGRGAGSYYRWWLQRGTLPLQVRNAHSLYLETLGELGVVGLLALVAALGAGVVAIAFRLRRATKRPVVAALSGVYAGFLVGLAIDWIWQLAAVGAVGIAALGALVASERRRGSWSDGALAVVSAVAIAVMLVGFFSARWLGESYAAARRGNIARALGSARASGRLEPWSTAPRLQRALLEERVKQPALAETTIDAAIRRDPGDWQLWLVKTRLALERGRGADAHDALVRASALNPHSGLFYTLNPSK